MIKKLKLLLLATLLISPLLLVSVKTSAATTVAITSPSSNATVSGSSFTVSGTATADRKITVSINGTEVGTTTSNGSGSWSLDVTGQSAGAKTVTATASVQYAYVGNANAATISVINTVTDEVVNTVSSTTNQGGILAISPDGTQMVSTSGYGGDGTIRVYSLADPENPTITNNITAPDSYAVNAIYSPSGNHFYVSSVESDFSSSTITRYVSATPGTSASVTGFNQTFPGGLAFNSDGSELYVSNVISGSLSVINAATNTQTSTFSTGGATFAGSIILASNNNDAYISATNQDAIIPVDIGGASAGSSITVGDGPQGLTFNEDESRVIVVNTVTNNLSSINTTTDTVVDTVSTGASTNPRVPVFNSEYSKLYVTFNGTDQVGVLDPVTFATNSTITVGDQPWGLALGPVETASDSHSFNLIASTSASLANTGTNMVTYALIAGALVIGSSVYIYRRKSNN